MIRFFCYGILTFSATVRKEHPCDASTSISEDLANDVENIADGIFSPLEGFLGQKDFESVISKGRLANELAWTIPIILDVDEATANKMKDAGKFVTKKEQREQQRRQQRQKLNQERQQQEGKSLFSEIAKRNQQRRQQQHQRQKQ